MNYSLKKTELTPVWIRDERETVKYPNNAICKEVFKNLLTGGKIVRRYDMIGNLIFTNEYEELYREMRLNFLAG